MLKNIIFDFDGTLADTLLLMFNSINELAPSFNFKVTPSNIALKYKDMPLKDILKELGIPIYKLPFLASSARKLMNSKLKDCNTFYGIKSTLINLKKQNFNLFILSSNSKKNILSFINHNNLNYFNSINSCLNLFGKARCLNKLIKNNKLNINETIYIGDETRDIEACKKLNLEIISVTWGYNTREFLKKYSPNYIIDNPTDILDIVNLIK